MSLNKKENTHFGDFLQSIDQFFSQSFNLFHPNELFSPSFPVKSYRQSEHFIIEAELAGVSKEQVQVEIYEHHVRIVVSHHEATVHQNDEKLVHVENKQFSQSERLIHLPIDVKCKAGKATFKNSLLLIRFPLERKTLEINESEH